MMPIELVSRRPFSTSAKPLLPEERRGADLPFQCFGLSTSSLHKGESGGLEPRSPFRIERPAELTDGYGTRCPTYAAINSGECRK